MIDNDIESIKGKHRNVKLEQVYDMDNLILADKMARKGKGHNYGVRRFDKDREENLHKIQEMLRERTYHTSPVRSEQKNCPCGKTRLITKLPYYPDHIIHHALMQVIGPTMTASYYSNSFASIKGRGTEMARRRTRKWIDLHKERDIVFAKLDFTKFYHNIIQSKCYEALCHMYHDDGIRWLLKEVVTAIDVGLGIGLFPIQPIANFYLNPLDRLIGLKFCRQVFLLRYCDDIVLLGFDTKVLWEAINTIRDYAANVLEQPLHTNINVEHLTNDVGLSFVGYVFFKDYTLIRKKMKTRMKRKLNKYNRKIAQSKNNNDKDKAEKRKYEILASYKGWLMHSDGRNLWYKTTGMKSFSDLNIKSNVRDKDGNIFFDVPMVSASFLVDQKIVVKDYQGNVQTKNGNGRYVVLIEQGGRDCKFVTNNAKLKNILDQCREQNVFPFEAFFRRRDSRHGVADYYFE